MIYHVDVTRPAGFARTADQMAESLAQEKQADIQAAGGSITVARTFDIDKSMLVVILPDQEDIGKFFQEGVHPYGPPMVSTSTDDGEPRG